MSDNNGGTSSGGNDDWVQDGEDYIYRGDSGATPPPLPGQPTTPPPAGPPPSAPYTTPPPAGPPPSAPFVTPPPHGAPAAPPGAAIPAPPGTPMPAAAGGPKKKRWPWIVAGVLLLCGLPLGGCVALIGFGVNEIGNVNDELRASTDTFIAEWNAGTPEAAIEAQCFDGGGEFPPIEWIADGATELEWEERSIAFVKRDGNSYLASNADSETSVIINYEDDSNGFVNATIRDTNGAGSANVELLFLDLDGDGAWELCGLSKN